MKTPAKNRREQVTGPPDGGFGWIVTAAAFFNHVIVEGICFTCGQAFQPPWEEQFGVSAGIAAWPHSLMTGCHLLAGPLVSALANVYGCRTAAMIGALIAFVGLSCSIFANSILGLIFSFGIVAGIGYGFTFMPSIVIVSYYFVKKRATATGLSLCGSGIGTFIFAPFLRYLIAEYGGWKPAAFIIAAISLNCLVFSLFFRPLHISKPKTSPSDAVEPLRNDLLFTGSIQSLPDQIQKEIMEESKTAETGKPNFKDTLKLLFDIHLFISPTFLILAISGFLTFCGFFVPFVYLPRYAESLGVSKTWGTMLVSLLGAINIFARILCGWLSDQPRVDALLLNNVALTLAGIATVLVPFLHHYWMLCCYCVVFAFGTACFAALRPIIAVELLGLHRLNNVLGLLLLFMGAAALVGSPLAGFLRDLTGDFQLSFHVTGTLVLLSGIMQFPLRIVSRWEQRSANKNRSMEVLKQS